MLRPKISLITTIILLLLSSKFSWANSLIEDTEGRAVRIPDKIAKVVVLTGTCIETIYILGEIDKVVGISRNMLETNPVYREIIKELDMIPVVAQDLRNVDFEKLLSLRPDLIIGIGPEHPYGMPPNLVKKIQSFHIPLLLMNLQNLDENYRSILILGKVFKKEQSALELIEKMREILRLVSEKVKVIPQHQKVKAIMLSQKPNQILGGYWGSQDIIRLAGGINTASEISDFVSEVSLEKIVSWNPDVITIVGTAPYRPEDILANPQLRNIAAVKKRRVYKYPYQLTGIFTPRVPLLISWHASKFYPELEIDWVKIADNFFKKFYGRSYDGPSD